MTATIDTIGAPYFRYEVQCVAPDGSVRWSEDMTNLVTIPGKTDILDKYFKGSAYTAAWFLGLKAVGTAVSADTLASHASWIEVTAYASATVPAITFGTTATGSNTATAVSYAINGTATVAGLFVTTNSAKGATTGTLYSVGDFGTARSVLNGDTLNATLTVSVS
jgi:hypothetical protein